MTVLGALWRFLCVVFFYLYGHLRVLHSFPTRRSSDLALRAPQQRVSRADRALRQYRLAQLDRKSTRLNSSHRCISYAVFCLKKKKRKTPIKDTITPTTSTTLET